MLELLAALLIFELWSGVTLSYIAGLFNGGQGLFRSQRAISRSYLLCLGSVA